MASHKSPSAASDPRAAAGRHVGLYSSSSSSSAAAQRHMAANGAHGVTGGLTGTVAAGRAGPAQQDAGWIHSPPSRPHSSAPVAQQRGTAQVPTVRTAVVSSAGRQYVGSAPHRVGAPVPIQHQARSQNCTNGSVPLRTPEYYSYATPPVPVAARPTQPSTSIHYRTTVQQQPTAHSTSGSQYATNDATTRPGRIASASLSCVIVTTLPAPSAAAGGMQPMCQPYTAGGTSTRRPVPSSSQAGMAGGVPSGSGVPQPTCNATMVHGAQSAPGVNVTSAVPRHSDLQVRKSATGIAAAQAGAHASAQPTASRKVQPAVCHGPLDGRSRPLSPAGPSSNAVNTDTDSANYELVLAIRRHPGMVPGSRAQLTPPSSPTSKRKGAARGCGPKKQVVVSPNSGPLSPEKAFVMSLPRHGHPTEQDGPGFLYVFESPLSHTKNCVKVGRSCGDRDHALSRVKGQERHWTSCTVKATMPTKFHKMAELLVHRVLDAASGPTVELRAVSCALPSCKTSHREWFTWRRAEAQQRRKALATRLANLALSKPALNDRIAAALLDALRSKVILVMEWAVRIADNLDNVPSVG
eukprot:scpid31087/ scgid0711/ 